MTTSEVRPSLTCECCGKRDDTVAVVECGYVMEIHGTVQMETVCEECEYQHCQDV